MSTLADLARSGQLPLLQKRLDARSPARRLHGLKQALEAAAHANQSEAFALLWTSGGQEIRPCPADFLFPMAGKSGSWAIAAQLRPYLTQAWPLQEAWKEAYDAGHHAFIEALDPHLTQNNLMVCLRHVMEAGDAGWFQRFESRANLLGLRSQEGAVALVRAALIGGDVDILRTALDIWLAQHPRDHTTQLRALWDTAAKSGRLAPLDMLLQQMTESGWTVHDEFNGAGLESAVAQAFAREQPGTLGRWLDLAVEQPLSTRSVMVGVMWCRHANTATPTQRAMFDEMAHRLDIPAIFVDLLARRRTYKKNHRAIEVEVFDHLAPFVGPEQWRAALDQQGDTFLPRLKAAWEAHELGQQLDTPEGPLVRRPRPRC